MPRGLKATVTEIVDLCGLIYSDDATEETTSAITDEILVLLDGAVAEKTEILRAALVAMVANHRHRFPLSGTCRCEACERAERLIDGRN